MSHRSERGVVLWVLSMLAALLLCCLALLAPAIDALCHGPITRAYNRRMFDLAQSAQLIGKPESAIVPTLGEPTSVWRSWSSWLTKNPNEPAPGAEWVITYNYAPCWLVPCGLFQVHLRNGRVSGLEQLDD
jgi:hypothetical protein